jgi:hypothetical protein
MVKFNSLLEALERESYELREERLWGDGIVEAREKGYPESQIDYYTRKRDEAVAEVMEVRKEIKRLLLEILKEGGATDGNLEEGSDA